MARPRLSQYEDDHLPRRDNDTRLPRRNDYASRKNAHSSRRENAHVPRSDSDRFYHGDDARFPRRDDTRFSRRNDARLHHSENAHLSHREAHVSGREDDRLPRRENAHGSYGEDEHLSNGEDATTIIKNFLFDNCISYSAHPIYVLRRISLPETAENLSLVQSILREKLYEHMNSAPNSTISQRVRNFLNQDYVPTSIEPHYVLQCVGIHINEDTMKMTRDILKKRTEKEFNKVLEEADKRRRM
jgi:hypothetical protein